MTTAFDTAELYACKDEETLNYETVKECLEMFYDDVYNEDEGNEEKELKDLIERYGSIEVSGYSRMRVSENFINGVADRLLIHAADDFSEEYGNPEGNGKDDDLTHAIFKEFHPELVSLLKRFLAKGTVWAHECVGRRTYSVEEIKTMFYKDLGE